MLRRIDTEQLKRDHPIEEVAARYGLELRRSGRTDEQVVEELAGAIAEWGSGL